MVYYNFRVQNCKDSFGNTTNLVFCSNCFLIKLDGNRFQRQTKSPYPADSIYVNLSYLESTLTSSTGAKNSRKISSGIRNSDNN